jgi:oligosaccharide repeat unit polymerase
LFSLTIGDWFFIKKFRILYHVDQKPLSAASYSTLTLIILFFIFFLVKKNNFNIFSVLTYGENALSSREVARNNKLSGIEDIFFEQVPNFFIFTTTILLIWKQGFIRYVWILFGLYIIVIAFMSGSRGYILQVILPIILFFLYRKKKYNPIKLFFVLFLGIFISNFIEIFRSLSSIEPKYLFDLVLNNSFNIHYIIASSGELSVSVNLLKLIKEIDISNASYQFGLNLFDQLVTFIPNAFLPYRPLIASEKFVYLFYNDIYNIGGGYGFFILQDGYWDFGILGSMLSMFSFLVLINFSFIFLYKKFKEGSLFYFYLFVIFVKNLMIFSVRSGVIASVKALWIDFIPLCIYFILLHILNLNNWKRKLK